MELIVNIIRSITNFLTRFLVKTPKQNNLVNDGDSEIVEFDPEQNPAKAKGKKAKELTSLDRMENAFAKYKEHHFKDDKFFPAAKSAKKKINPSMLCIHFAYMRTLSGLTNYFSKTIANEGRAANSTWGMDNDTGETHAYLRPDQLIWTNGKGRFINKHGKWVSYTNDISLSIEVAQLGNRPYGDACYREIARRVHWMIKNCPDFRVWFITGHEFIAPDRKSDPGEYFDWRKLFVDYIGIRADFYEVYLSYLDDNKKSTAGNKVLSAQKQQRVQRAVNKIAADLIDKPADYCF